MSGDIDLLHLDEGWVREITPWWMDPETKKWMGGYPPARALQLAQAPPAEFRGRTVLSRTALVGVVAGNPVSLIDFESYADNSCGVGLVVHPSHRNKGYGRRTLHSLVRSHHMEGIRLLFAGIESENLASIRCFEAAGFTSRMSEPDHEGIIYFDLYLHGDAREEELPT